MEMKSITAIPVSDSLFLSEDPTSHIDTLPIPPCSYRMGCCGTIGPIDYLLCGGHVLCLTGMGISIYNQSNFYSVAFGIVEILFAGSHFLVRKYGDISRVTDRFRQIVSQYQLAINRETIVVQTLKGTVADLEDANREYQEANQRFEASNKKLNEEINWVGGQMQQFKQEGLSLQQTNQALRKRIQEVQGAQEKATQQLNQLSKTCIDFGKEIEQIAQTTTSIEVAADTVDFDGKQKTIQSSLQELETLVERNEKLCKQFITTLGNQNQQLKQQVSQLETEASSFHDNAISLTLSTRHIDEESKGLQRRTEQIRKIDSNMQGRTGQLQTQTDTLKQETENLKLVVEQLQSQTESLQGAGKISPRLNDALNQLQTGLQDSAETLKAGNEAIQRQIDELGRL